jgi:hypothetical protein
LQAYSYEKWLNIQEMAKLYKIFSSIANGKHRRNKKNQLEQDEKTIAGRII